MSAERDMTRIVRSWLRTDEHESAERVLDNVLALLDATPQRRSLWPARRIAGVNTYAKLAIAAAAVVAVAVVGMSLLPHSGGVGVGAPTVSPSPSHSATPAASPSPTLAAVFPPAGPLAVGIHSTVREGVSFSFRVASSAWTSGDGIWIARGQEGKPDGSVMIFWPSTPDNVYADPCGHKALSPPANGSAVALAAAVSTLPGTDLVTGPSSVTVGGRPAQHVAITIRHDINCGPNDFYLWYDESTGGETTGGRWAQELGETLWVWIVDVDGRLIWIDGETYGGGGPAEAERLRRIVDSIRFE
jgi:hypothetical protein